MRAEENAPTARGLSLGGYRGNCRDSSRKQGNFDNHAPFVVGVHDRDVVGEAEEGTCGGGLEVLLDRCFHFFFSARGRPAILLLLGTRGYPLVGESESMTRPWPACVHDR